MVVARLSSPRPSNAIRREYSIIKNATTQQSQLDVIYKTLKSWAETLFGDGRLEKAFKEAGFDSGM